jgi:FAD/FMN-containing dehydrogenase/Fe-S oxidoreductase
MTETLLPGLERRLRAQLAGDVQFDRFTRGRYATDASHYQMMPIGVVAPRSIDDLGVALSLARKEGVSVLPRGGGTSQCGQTVNTALIVDCSKHLDRLLELDIAGRRCAVEPGIVLDELNRRLRPHGLWFPVDISTASRATIGGMVGNNSCGARSLRFGNTRENVMSVDALLADGTAACFGPTAPDLSDLPSGSPLMPLARRLLAIAAAQAHAIETRFPKVQRRVGGYNLDALLPGRNELNLAHILVGSEGTLACSSRIELKLAPLLGPRAVGACHFGSFFRAMEAARHIVALGPIAVELVDRTMLALARDIAMFQPTIAAVVRGDPEAILLVEFAEESMDESMRRLRRLHEVMDGLGLDWSRAGAGWGGVIDVLEPALQAAIAEMRTAGLNIMMSMKDEGKPVSFVEDCAVPLEHLADYTARLTDIFARHGTRGTWYAHASVGCLHVRPVLNLRLEKDVAAMRAIAEEAFELVKAFKGSHSGEHGDGIVRSEFHGRMFGEELVRAFEEVKTAFDPAGFYNPGKIVQPPRFDDRSLFRYGPHYHAPQLRTQLDWSDFPGAGGGFQGAVEMCNNNGACRALVGGVMCPSYRVTRDERDVTRGRANVLRLAITGQLGPDALVSDEMARSLALCVSCKACRRECPTGVDMARMKIEVQAARLARHGFSLRERLVGYLPRYAPLAARWSRLANLPADVPLLRRLMERHLRLSARRSLPRWRADAWREPAAIVGDPDSPREVILLVDTFNRYYEPENVAAALSVLNAAGVRVHLPQPADGRPLCCGRTFLAVGAVAQARREAARCVAALAPLVARGAPVVGLEPSCLLGLRDEIPALLATAEARLVAANALLLEEHLMRELQAGRLALRPRPLPRRALLHGHCHQKSFGALPAAEAALKLVPELAVETIESSCCGMAGAFGYGAETIDVSLAMAELSLLPAVRRAGAEALVVADGISCRQQIADGAGREALHVVRVLAMSLAGEETAGPTRQARPDGVRTGR